MIKILNQKHITVVAFITIYIAGCSVRNPKKEFLDYNDVFLPNKIKNLKKKESISIGFGSCLKQDGSLKIFDAIKNEGIDLFLMIGDNVYGSSNNKDLSDLRLAYKKQKQNFKKLNLDFPIEAIWDDHDYGLNDGGKEYQYRDLSKELFLEFWEIPENDIRRKRRGLYHHLSFILDSLKIQIIFLDTRYFRDKLTPSDIPGRKGKERYMSSSDTSLTMLGIEQWDWFKNISKVNADIRIIVSSIQFIASGHGWESWKNLPHEKNKMEEIIDRFGTNNTIFISGDRHRGGLYKKLTQSDNIIYEITSSSLNAPYLGEEEEGPYRIGDTFKSENYGVINIDKSKGLLSMKLKNIKGETIRFLEIEI